MRGYVEKRTGKRGVSYRAVLEVPGPNGERRRRRATFATKKEAERALIEWAAERERGVIPTHANKLTTAAYLTRWLATLGESVRPQTRRRYADLMRRHVIPHVGNVHLAKLTPLHVRSLQATCLEAGLSPTTVAFLHATLHRALKDAESDGLIPRNVAKLVKPPRRTRPEFTVWTAEQTAAFLAVADQDEYAALWRLALLTGMRRGELLGLKWDDVDLVKGLLSVRRTYSRGATGAYEPGVPKTASARRSIALQSSVVEALRQHRTRQLELRLAAGSMYHDEGYIFTTSTGRPLHPNSIASRLTRLIAAANVPRIRFHDQRHTSATLMLANGEHPKKVQERLGHSSIAITLDRHSHVTMDMQREAADRLEELVKRAARDA